jgi:16S rRNA (guanine527-N7)-methyltransferase
MSSAAKKAANPMKPLDIPANIAPVSQEMAEKLRQYHALLLKWQEKINLVSPNTIPEAWERHFIDSAQLAPLLPEGAHNLYDLGSGAGFAGMVLAILRPDLKVTMIESDAKKCAFLSAVSRETGMPVSIVNKRIEAARNELPAPDLVTARALASLPELFGYVWPWAQEKPELSLIFPKGAQAKAEIEAARDAGWAFETALVPSKTEAGAQILMVTKLGKSAG